MSDGVSLSFVLLTEARYPDPRALIAAAASFGETLTLDEASNDGPMSFRLADGNLLMVMLVDAPHPDAPHMPLGLASPSPEQLDSVAAHYIVTVPSLDGPRMLADTRMARLTAAITKTSPAVAAMTAPGVVFYKADFFVNVVSQSEFPMLVCVDLTMAPEGEERMSMLTHGLQRYGREEFYVTASRQGQGAMDFVLGLTEWMLNDPDKHLPTGDTVGRSADEKVLVQRVPNPTGEGPEVVRLDLDL